MRLELSYQVAGVCVALVDAEIRCLSSDGRPMWEGEVG